LESILFGSFVAASTTILTIEQPSSGMTCVSKRTPSSWIEAGLWWGKLRCRWRIGRRAAVLYVVEFGDVALGGQQYWNAGVAVFETNRIFGGDSGYYYVGNYSVKGSQIDAQVKVVRHNPNWESAFGDASDSFNIKIQGTVNNGVIQGQMEQLDRPGLRLPVRLTWKENLP
jgi:hypothetical protein